MVVIDRGGLGEYYDVQGSTWTNPPLLGDPSQTVQIGSRSYSLFYLGEQIRTIAWHEGGAAYWIQNTLTNGVQPREMLAMAEQTRPVISPRPDSPRVTAALPTLQDLKLPPRALVATSLTSKLAAALGLVGLAAVALLALLVLSRRRELILLREQIAQAMTLEARQRPLLATGASIPVPEPAPAIHHAQKGRRRAILAATGVSIAGLLAVLAVHFSHADLFPSSALGGPSVPVAVFNATSTRDAAHRIADELRADRVHLGPIGNINASLGTGVYVLYPPGAQAQAQRVAQLIPNLTLTVEPIQPQVQNAVGRHKEIVVMFD
ncbi:MAG: LytR C-terminal domain-containing protein [Solirubrobacteraceae bacterium]